MKANSVFFDLSPEEILDSIDGILDELRPGVRCTGRVIPLNSLENRVFEVELEDHTSLVAKFYRPARWSADQIQEEHDFVQHLLNLEIPVVAPYRVDGDSLFESENGILFCLFPKVRGRLSDELTSEQLTTLGRYIARIHNTSSLFQVKHRLRLTTQEWGEKSLAFMLQIQRIYPDYQARYRAVCETFFPLAKARIQNLPLVNCHGDCHLGNVLWNGDSPFLIDFDDMVTAPAVQDVWTIVRGRDEQAIKDREAFLKGYQVFRDFDHLSLDAIEALRGLRLIQYSAWIARRWDDPAFKKVFPDFDKPKYWEEEIQSLYEIIELLRDENRDKNY